MKMTLVCMVIIPEVSFRDSGFPLEGFGIPLRNEFWGSIWDSPRIPNFYRTRFWVI